MLVDRSQHKAEIPITALCNSNKAASLSHPQTTKGMAVLQWHGVTLPLTEVPKQLSLFDTNNTATYTCHPYPFALGKAIDSASCINEVTEYGRPAVAAVTQATPVLACTFLVCFSTLLHSTSATERRYFILGPALSPSLMAYTALQMVLVLLPLLMLFSIFTALAFSMYFYDL